MKNLVALWLAFIPIVKLFFAKLFLTTRVFFPLNMAGLPLGGNLPASAGSAPGNEALVLSSRTILTSAQLLALLGTPITLVPAPPVGFQIVPLFAVIRMLAGSAAYTDVGGAVQFVVGGQVYALASNAIFLVTVAPSRRVQVFAMPGATGVAANPPTEDAAALQINKITNNLAAGNGTCAITVYYTLEPTV